MAKLLNRLAGGLVVSCQALEKEPLHGSAHMAAMARAAAESGAVGIRSNSVADIQAIKMAVDLPVIGLLKRDVPGFEVFITPTLEDVWAVYKAGADIVALDATMRERPGNETLEQVLAEAKANGIPVMADISTFEEGLQAAQLGADFVSTTLCGYTSYSQCELPNLALVERLAAELTVPVVAEGGIHKPEQAAEALRLGASFVVVGSAITRPQWITKQYTEAIEGLSEKRENRVDRH